MADQSQQNDNVMKLMEIGLRAEDAENGICNVVWRINDAVNDIVIDAQFLTCYDEYTPLYEKETDSHIGFNRFHRNPGS